MKIGVFDSGKGGTTVLEAIRRKLPDEEYYYIADSKNCPYGEKSDEELFKIVDSVVTKLIESDVQIVVVACNTATTRAIDHLRARFPNIVFVGVEPAVKLAAKIGGKKILVLATPGTAKSERLLKIVDHSLTNQAVTILPCAGLADAIEHDMGVDAVLEDLLRGIDRDYDVIVLGCTHYSLIKDEIQKFFPFAKLVDGNEGVANRVVNLVKGGSGYSSK